MLRRSFMALAPAAGGAMLAQISPAWRLIAHRGGIVDAAHAENSLGSIQAAIDRGYWMLEVDIRRTRDGQPVLQHDPDFTRFYGDGRKVEDLTWAEVQKLRSNPGNDAPIHFAELCRICKGRIRLMLDIKSDAWPADFYAGLMRELERNDLLRSAYLLGGGKLKQHFQGKCFLSANRESLSAAVERGEDVARNYFLFELGSELREPSFELCRRHAVSPVAAINTFRYTMAKRDETKGPEEDVARLKALGVVCYQIDSRYDYLFLRGSQAAAR